MWFKRHLPFLKEVLLYSLSAFGGPQGHLLMMKKHFVERRKDVTENELLDFNSFTQLLPGPSSSQTVMLIGLKRGGVILGLLTMLIWVIPASIIMGAFSFLVYYLGTKNAGILQIFQILGPVSIAFIAYAAYLYTQKYVTNTITLIIMFISMIASIVFLNPWTFPVLIILGAAATTVSSKRYPDKNPEKRKSIKWRVLWIFLGAFAILAILAQLAIANDWTNKLIFIQMENFYRFGSIIFGGGQVLMPMMLYQFVYRPRIIGGTPLVSADQIITGYGMVNSIPGPVYSLAAYVGGMMLAPMGWSYQLLGVVIGTVFIFLPGIFLILFLFPIYQNLQYHVLIFRALEGIRAVITGILWGSTYILFKKTIWDVYNAGQISLIHFVFYSILILVAYILLRYFRVSARAIVISSLLISLMIYLFG